MNETIPGVFQALFREHYPVVVRKLTALVGDRATAEDLAQDVFIRLYRSPPERLDVVGAWLHRTLTRIAYDHMRSRSSRRQLMERERLRTETAELDAIPASEEMAILNWEKEVVRRVLTKLSERDRTALLLKEQGYSYEEIAGRLGLNPKTVGSVLGRASVRFKKQFAKEEAQDV